MSELAILIWVGVLNAAFLAVLIVLMFLTVYNIHIVKHTTNGLVAKLEAGAYREGVTEGREQMETR